LRVAVNDDTHDKLPFVTALERQFTAVSMRLTEHKWLEKLMDTAVRHILMPLNMCSSEATQRLSHGDNERSQTASAFDL
jgi:hypothetical protein